MSEKFDFSKISAEGGSASGGEDQKEFENLEQEEKDEIVGEAQEHANNIEDLRVKEEAEKEKIDREIAELKKELSPEIIEKIMDKVQDIDKKGTAYSVIGGPNYGEFKHILKEGLLGGGSKEKWVAKARSKSWGSVVFFNIVGRARELLSRQEKEGTEIGRHAYGNLIEQAAIIFDTSHLDELPPKLYANISSRDVKLNTFFADDYKVAETWKKYFFGLKPGDPEIISRREHLPEQTKTVVDIEGKPLPESENGFVLSCRVAPRLFRGIVFGPPQKKGREGTEEGHADEIISTMFNVYKNKPNYLLPVYDVYGNLYWPKKMSYEQIKKIVAERDKK